MTRREHVIVEILERWDDLADPISSGNGGDRQGAPLTPHEPGCTVTTGRGLLRCTCAYRHITTLETLIGQLRDTDRRLWWHLTERYIACRRVQRQVTSYRRNKNRKRVPFTEHKTVVVYSTHVEPALVEKAVGWLAGRWPAGGEPCLPKDMAAA